jgi:hypothetical protein
MLLLLGCDDAPTPPSGLFAFTISPPTIAAGATSVGTVTLRGRTRQVVRISLSSSDAVAAVPLSIVIPGGTGSAEFTVRTRLVAADTVAWIAASAGEMQREVALRIVAPIGGLAMLGAVQLEATRVRGGQNVQGTVRLTAAAPTGGVSVALRSSNTAAVVPATVRIPSGATSASFTVLTRTVIGGTQVDVTATYSNQVRTVALRVTP